MKTKIQDADFRDKLIAYLEDIIKEDLDDFPDKYVFEGSYGTECFILLKCQRFCFVLAPRSFNTPTILSAGNIYAALPTIDLISMAENTCEPHPLSTSIKQQCSSSIVYASPSSLYGSPSIPYASP